MLIDIGKTNSPSSDFSIILTRHCSSVDYWNSYDRFTDQWNDMVADCPPSPGTYRGNDSDLEESKRAFRRWSRENTAHEKCVRRATAWMAHSGGDDCYSL